MIYRVFHHRPGSLGFMFPDQLCFPDDYDQVADVEASDLDEAYALTQTDRYNWIPNPSIFNVQVTEARSSSTGDMFVDEDGRLWQVDFIGWQAMGSVLIPALIVPKKST